MPLSEFLRMARGKLESGQQKPCPPDPSSRSENDLVELVWENGQIMMQGQSSRVLRSPTRNHLPSNTSRVRDAGVRNANSSRFGKFGGVEPMLNDMAPLVPSGDLDLGQDDDMVPWLTYPIDDNLGQDYVSEALPEISGVTGNGMSTQNSFVSVDKRSRYDQTAANLHVGGNITKASSCKDRLISSWAPQHRQTSDALGSGASDIIGNNTSDHLDANMKMERPNTRPPTNNSNFLNFSHFSRPANLVKASNIQNSDGIPASGSSGVDRIEIKEKSTLVEKFKSTPKDMDLHGSSATLSMINSRKPAANSYMESRPHERTENLCQETSVKNDKPINISNTDNSTKGVPDGERNEPMVASSSVGSGNSADRVSCEHTHNSKRKFRDIEESECRSDDVETESLDAKKRTHVRGCKRSRAAEVHNLSERRRRDRINEKMRALQELIPNCNKADKASMLDEAIEYLKTLQLQVQIMSMGAGLCMPPMMYPSGMQHMHPAHLPHFPAMGVGMGPGMGYGIGMLDMNGGSSGFPIFSVPPMQVPHFPPSVSGIANFQRIPGPNFPMFGHPGQGLPNSVPRPPCVPLSGPLPVTPTTGINALRIGTNNDVPSTSPAMNPTDPVTTINSQSCNAEASCSRNDKSNQLKATNVALDQSTAVQEKKQATATPTSSTTIDISKEPGCD